MRTITVKGTGNVTASPDYIVISFTLAARSKEYEKAMALAAQQIDSVNDALAKVGFEKGSLKTTDFNVKTDFKSVREKSGSYRQDFVGYICLHEMKLEFDFDSALLGRTLSAIAEAAANPQLSISFTVKDPGTISDELLRSAAVSARKKADILCQASGAHLGQLITIDYSWDELRLCSDTRYMMDCDCMPSKSTSAHSIDFTPGDIKVDDTATFVWEIE